MVLNTSATVSDRSAAPTRAAATHTAMRPPPQGAGQAEYGGVFQSYVARNTDLLARQLASTPGLISQELQARIWLTLSYGLRLDWAWPGTRDLLLMVAPRMEQAGVWDEWLPCVAQGIERSQAVGDRATEAALSLHLGHLLFRLRDFKAARRWLEHAAQVALQEGLANPYAEALARKAQLILRSENDVASAMEWVEAALARVEPDSVTTAFCRFVRGTLRLARLDYGAASEDFETARRLAQEQGDARLSALALVNLGRLYEQRELYEPAETFYEWAIATFTKLEDPINLAVTQMNLGIVYMCTGKIGKAMRSYDAAEATFRRLQERRYLAMLYNNRGMAAAEAGDLAQAVSAYQTACELWAALDEPLAWANVLDNLGMLYSEAQNTRAALASFDHGLQVIRDAPEASNERQRLQAELRAHRQDAAKQPGWDEATATPRHMPASLARTRAEITNPN